MTGGLRLFRILSTQDATLMGLTPAVLPYGVGLPSVKNYRITHQGLTSSLQSAYPPWKYSTNSKISERYPIKVQVYYIVIAEVPGTKRTSKYSEYINTTSEPTAHERCAE